MNMKVNNHRTEPLDSLRKRPNWSFSRINSLVNFCSLAWAFRYIYREEPLHTPAAPVFGGAFHSALAFHASRRADDRPVTAGETAELFAGLFTDRCRHSEPPVQFKENENIELLREKGRRMVAVYIDGISPEEKVVGVSVPFSVPLIDSAGKMLSKPLIGEYDLTIEHDGVYTIVDWKTAARKWPDSKPRTDLQPTCYLYANYRGTGNTAAAFRFDVVTKTKEPQYHQYLTRREPENFARLGELVRVLERTVAHECFYPSDSSWECRNCPYGLACQSWHRERARSFHHFELAA